MTIECKGESSEITRIIGSSQRSWTKDEVDQLFEKQAETELRQAEAIEEMNRKLAEDSSRNKQLRKKLQHGFPNDVLSKDRGWQEVRRRQVAGARFEAREIPKYLLRRRKEGYREVLKQGVLEGAIQIHETPDGFELDTPLEKVREYVLKHPNNRNHLPKSSDLREGKFLLGTVHDFHKERVKLLRDRLIEEFQPKDSADYMAIDFAVSNYFRGMYATRMEMNCLMYADDYSMEMFEVVADGLQPYIHACQNQFLKTLRALRESKQASTPNTSITYNQAYNRTDVNIQHWGPPLLLALQEITEKKQQNIPVNEIKQTMAKYANRFDTAKISNDSIGYMLRRFRFNNKIHTHDGNRYNISRQEVEAIILREGLKP